ncbi:MAG: sigma-E processing peptidase SpoIIGA [Eubacterium sp.]|nr:sigma-E processing peptidase SpoIIGA [Eubacterium sp.]MDD7209975.1 sigma-E processing peptidase SpoIIGA [Lachnospiraceae bacterium]MDY5497193.1 sigma-E processing peptidase SpoIIGA [Anaerobutyricum sp.]
MKVVPAQILFYNFFADYCILSLVRQNLFPQITRKRIVGGAAVLSLSYFLWKWCYPLFPGTLWKITGPVTVIVLLCLLFKIHSAGMFAKMMAVLFLYVFLIGGMEYYITVHIPLHVTQNWKGACVSLFVMGSVSAVLLAWGTEKGKEKRIRRNLYDIKISRQGKWTLCRGLYDSGNLLQSRLTGRGVMVMQKKEAEKILTEEEKKIINDFYGKEAFPWKEMLLHLQTGFYTLSYVTVDHKNAQMPAFMADRIVVEKNGEVFADVRGMIGISKEDFFQKEDIAVLLPADIFEQENRHAVI